MRAYSFSMCPTTWKEWWSGLGAALWVLAAPVIVAFELRTPGVVFFWYGWAAYALSSVLHMAYRGVLLWKRGPLEVQWVDKVLLAAIYVSGYAMFILLMVAVWPALRH